MPRLKPINQLITKIPRIKPINQLITKIPSTLDLFNITNITETIGEITTTLTASISLNVTETFEEIIKEFQSTDVLTLIIQSRIFTIILFVITVFVAVGFLLKIIYK